MLYDLDLLLILLIVTTLFLVLPVMLSRCL